jgi:hypothetical protein
MDEEAKIQNNSNLPSDIPNRAANNMSDVELAKIQTPGGEIVNLNPFNSPNEVAKHED